MEGFSYFKNEHLRKALRLRKEGKHPEALGELRLACAQNDGEALYVMAETYDFGGFGVNRDKSMAKKFYKKSAVAKCPWGIVDHSLRVTNAVVQARLFRQALESQDPFACGMCFADGLGVAEDRDMAREYFLQAYKEGIGFALRALCMFKIGTSEERFAWALGSAQEGDGQGQYFVADCFLNACGVEENQTMAFEWYLKGALQKNDLCLKIIPFMFEVGLGCEPNIQESVKFCLEANSAKDVLTQLNAKIEDEDEDVRLQQLFAFGRGLKANELLHQKVEKKGRKNITANPIHIFEESCRVAKKAVFCFLWIFKSNGWLSPDVRKLIGKMVWESRTNPRVWGLSLASKNKKRQSKRIKK